MSAPGPYHDALAASDLKHAIAYTKIFKVLKAMQSLGTKDLSSVLQTDKDWLEYAGVLRDSGRQVAVDDYATWAASLEQGDTDSKTATKDKIVQAHEGACRFISTIPEVVNGWIQRYPHVKAALRRVLSGAEPPEPSKASSSTAGPPTQGTETTAAGAEEDTERSSRFASIAEVLSKYDDTEQVNTDGPTGDGSDMSADPSSTGTEPE
jgi:hypothetical protein